MSAESNDARLHAQIPSDLKRTIRVEAAKQDKQMSTLIREILYDWADAQDVDYNTTDD